MKARVIRDSTAVVVMEMVMVIRDSTAVVGDGDGDDDGARQW